MKVRLTSYAEEQDIEVFLSTFERAMRVHEVLQREWPKQLLAVLTGKARSSLAGLLLKTLQ
jgi:hypothetical protein